MHFLTRTFSVRSFAECLSVRSFVGGLSLLCSAGASSGRFFVVVLTCNLSLWIFLCALPQDFFSVYFADTLCVRSFGRAFSMRYFAGTFSKPPLAFSRDFFRTPHRRSFRCALFRMGVFLVLFRGNFSLRYFIGAFFPCAHVFGLFRALFRRTFSVSCFADTFWVRSFARGFSGCSFARAFIELFCKG